MALSEQRHEEINEEFRQIRERLLMLADISDGDCTAMGL
jgi:hypothetical protein